MNVPHVQVLHGLAYLHEQGVVHRDIKGANILTGNEVWHHSTWRLSSKQTTCHSTVCGAVLGAEGTLSGDVLLLPLQNSDRASELGCLRAVEQLIRRFKLQLMKSL